MGFSGDENDNTPQNSKGRYTYGQSFWHYIEGNYFHIKGLRREEDALAFCHAYISQGGYNDTMEEKEFIKEIHEFTKWSRDKTSEALSKVEVIDVPRLFRIE